MHKNATKCNETLIKWCKNKHGASKIIDSLRCIKDEFIKFKDACLTPEGIKWTEWVRRMRDLNIGNQRCGGDGYRENMPASAKGDAKYARIGKENLWHKFTDKQVMQFVHANYYLHPKLKEFVTDDDDVRKFQKTLVRNLPLSMF
jgi:hypothetical protein